MSFYIHVQTPPGSSIQDWALSLVFGGRPVGSLLSGLLIMKQKRFKVLLVINLVFSTICYASLAAGWLRESGFPGYRFSRMMMANRPSKTPPRSK
jgi:hypothetical protein